VLQPDLCVLLSDFPVLADTPDYLIFDLTRREAAGHLPSERVRRAAKWVSASGRFYRFPSRWRRLERGMKTEDVRGILGSPTRVERDRRFRKPVETWFYAPDDAYMIVFVDNMLFLRAESLSYGLR
jgi:hypothetical protein